MNTAAAQSENLESVELESEEFDKFVDRLPEHQRDTMSQFQISSDQITLDTGESGFCGRAGYRRDVSDSNREIKKVKFEAEASRDRYAGTPGLVVNGEFTDTFEVDEQPNRKTWSRDTYTVDTSSTEVKTIGFGVKDTSSRYCNYLDHGLELNVYDTTFVVEDGTGQDDDSVPMYDGYPRSNYTYTGTEEDLFERWQEGSVSTEFFQTATARGDGTASLELETSDPPTSDEDTYSKILEQGETIAEEIGESDGNDGLVLKRVNQDGTADLREPSSSTVSVPPGEVRTTILDDTTPNTYEYVKVCSTQPDRNRASVVVSTERSRAESGCPGPDPVANSDDRPTDPNRDIIFEDVNGDGSITRDDADLLANNERNIPEDDVTFFDPNGDGKIGIFMYTAIGSNLDGPEAILDNVRPNDPDGDGLFEDVDGDGQVTQKDLSVLEDQLEGVNGIEIPKEDVQYFDADNNGQIGEQMLDEIRALIDTGPPPIGDSDSPPRDPDGDGLFEDVDGDGKLRPEDADVMRENLRDLSTEFFDFDSNGSISLSDSSALRLEIASSLTTLSLESDSPQVGEASTFSLTTEEFAVEGVRLDWTGDGSIDEVLDTDEIGNASDRLSVDHAYDNPGEYEARAVINLEGGLQIEATSSVSVSQSDVPTYKGRPRDDYAYTGNNRDLFRRWQKGAISTTSFQFRTEMGEGTASLVLESQKREISVNVETTEPTADKPVRLSVSTANGTIEEARWDFDSDNIVESRGSSVEYTYQKSGEYVVQADVKTENGYTEKVSTPVEIAENKDSLRFNVESVKLPETATDRKIISPRAKIQTNAQKVLFYVGEQEARLFDDGNHADSAQGDKLYSNTLNVGGILGEKEAGLRFEKGDQEASRSLGDIEFLRTPPKPGLDVTVNDDNITIDTSRNGFPDTTNVTIEIFDSDSEANAPIDTIQLECSASSDCKTRLDNSYSAGSKLLVNATQTYRGLTSKPTTDSVTITDDRSIESASVSKNEYGSGVDIEFRRGQSWYGGKLRIAPVGFSAEEVSSAFVTVDGERQQELTVSQRFFRYIYFREDVVVPSELIGNEGTVTLSVELELSDGTVLSEKIVQAPVVEDETPPTDVSISARSLPNDPSNNVRVEVSGREDLSDSVQFQLTTRGEVVWSGEASTQDRNLFVKRKKLSLSGPSQELSLSVTDSAGNTATDTTSALVKPGELLQPVEVNGNPRSKINLVVYGQGMSTSETREALNQNLEFFFNERDLSVHGNFRDYFNWYIVDSEKDLCQQFDPGSSSLGDDCPTMTDNPGFKFGQTDTIKRGRTAMILLSKERFRAYMFDDYTLIDSQDPSSPVGVDTNVFAHELGHLIWGFDDEYGQDNTIRGAFPTEFFRQADNTDTYDVEKYSNTFESVQKCESKMQQVYDSLDPSDCEEQKNGAIVLGDKGRSLMYFNQPVYYQTHVKRINYLVENSPVLEAS
jgi:hypothetical protein